jgi:hypothetical protein
VKRVVFGSSARERRPWLKKPKLWTVLAILFLLHGTIGALMISHFECVPLIQSREMASLRIACAFGEVNE